MKNPKATLIKIRKVKSGQYVVMVGLKSIGTVERIGDRKSHWYAIHHATDNRYTCWNKAIAIDRLLLAEGMETKI